MFFYRENQKKFKFKFRHNNSQKKTFIKIYLIIFQKEFI